MKKKFLLPIIIGILILLPNSSHAVLQANGNTGAAYNLNDWMSNIRKMENLAGAMGLSEELNENFTSKTSNNIDVHMERNTEYGAMAILSASAYGNPSKINDGETTTGNITGVVMKINGGEWTATQSGLNSSGINLGNAANRYKDNYDNYEYKYKAGDAIEETKNWHNSSQTYWFVNHLPGGLIRANSTSIFDYSGRSWGGIYEADINSLHYTRAVVVCGEGL